MITNGTKVHATWAHPNNLYTVTGVNEYTVYLLSGGGETYSAGWSQIYTGEPTEAHWTEYLARNTWARR